MTWLDPWYSIIDSPEQVAAMERRLGAELSRSHPLHSVPLRAVGRRYDCDDALFAFEDGTGRVAVVHLTWSNRPKPPDFPTTIVFPSLDAWRVDGMQADHDEQAASGR